MPEIPTLGNIEQIIPPAEQALYEDPALSVYQLENGVSFSQKNAISPIAANTSPHGIEQTLEVLLQAGDGLFAVSRVHVPGHEEEKLAISLVSSVAEGGSKLLGFVDEGIPLVIGRGMKTGIEDATLSPRHFEVTRTSDKGFDIKNLDSAKGTLLAKRGSEITTDKPAKPALGGLRRLVSARRRKKGMQAHISQTTRWVVPDDTLNEYFDVLPQAAKDDVGSMKSDFIAPSWTNSTELAGNAQRYDFRDGRVGDVIEIQLDDGSVINGRINSFVPVSTQRENPTLMPRLELLADYTPQENGQPGNITYFTGDTFTIAGAGWGTLISGSVSRHTPIGYGAQYRVGPEEAEGLAKEKGYSVDEKGRVFLRKDDGELIRVSAQAFRGPGVTPAEVTHFSVTRRMFNGEERKTEIF